jgi:hypothetical protein
MGYRCVMDDASTPRSSLPTIIFFVVMVPPGTEQEPWLLECRGRQMTDRA